MWKGGSFREAEEDVERPLDEGHEIELPDRQESEGKREGDGTQDEGAGDVAEDHRPLAVPAVHECAREETKDEVRNRADGSRESGLSR